MITGLKQWTVTVSTEPEGREETFEVEAVSGVHAIVEASLRFRLREDEFDHTVIARIGPPREIKDEEVKTNAI